MNTKIITMTALLGVFLAGSNAYAWGNSSPVYHTHHKVKTFKVIKHVYVKPSTKHTHPANGLTNDTYHDHPNGNNHHVHNYGTGGHKHGAYYYSICPYEH